LIRNIDQPLFGFPTLPGWGLNLEDGEIERGGCYEQPFETKGDMRGTIHALW